MIILNIFLKNDKAHYFNFVYVYLKYLRYIYNLYFIINVIIINIKVHQGISHVEQFEHEF